MVIFHIIFISVLGLRIGLGRVRVRIHATVYVISCIKYMVALYTGPAYIKC